MKIQRIFPVLAVAFVLISCKTGTKPTDTSASGEWVEYNNPPAEGFNAEGSHSIAVLLADKVMNAMGGRKNWDETRYVTWNFFGQRGWLWDRQDRLVRKDQEGQVVVLNEEDKSGKAWMNGREVTHPDSLRAILDNTYKQWINDSYWLLMPFKLKDSGVTLTYIGESNTLEGKRADEIRLTFDNVGITPSNAYHVWVEIDSDLITQWAWYRNREDEEPVFVQSWNDYRQYGDILLASGRGERQLTEVNVLKKVSDSAFTSPDPYKSKEM